MSQNENKKKGNKLRCVNMRVPLSIHKKLEKSAKKNRRKVGPEALVLIEQALID